MINKTLVLLAGATTLLAGCGTKTATDTAATTTSAAPAATRVRGVVQSVDTNAVTIQGYDGKTTTVPIDGKTGFAWVVGSNLSTLKTGDFIGTATSGPDSALRAVELVIFPEAMRGSGEGHYGWDVPGVVAASGGNGGGGASGMTNGTVQQQSGQNQSGMTNGTVRQQSRQNASGQNASGMTNGTVQEQSGMTNGTVSSTAGTAGETSLTIGYKGGTAKVLVPAGTPIVRFEPTQRSMLAKGQKVFIVKTADAPGAKFVAMGKDGLTPPM
ncbi:hypothetical protein [Sphingomonas sp. PAMC 26617]|uniref:hypothetical protein n=1 Tax=Sphingomonas sp. PAMC 26617 TaxID=1112216 RepID=UPI00028988F0|nr:hypothetical protein [Sphingomonas sp. PAMC 26617]